MDEIHRADATDPGAPADCCDGVDAVFSSIGLMGRSSKLTCRQVDYAANRNLLEEARRAGLKKFIYTSVVRAPGLEKLQLVRAKRAFEEELRRSGMPHTILYPNGFFSDMDEFLAMARVSWLSFPLRPALTGATGRAPDGFSARPTKPSRYPF